MVRPGILGKEARPQNKAGVVFSILIPLLAAILLFVVIQAKLRGVQLPDFVIFIEAVGFVVVILAGTWFLIRGRGSSPACRSPQAACVSCRAPHTSSAGRNPPQHRDGN
jgi:hypothetical protein